MGAADWTCDGQDNFSHGPTTPPPSNLVPAFPQFAPGFFFRRLSVSRVNLPERDILLCPFWFRKVSQEPFFLYSIFLLRISPHKAPLAPNASAATSSATRSAPARLAAHSGPGSQSTWPKTAGPLEHAKKAWPFCGTCLQLLLQPWCGRLQVGFMLGGESSSALKGSCLASGRHNPSTAKLQACRESQPANQKQTVILTKTKHALQVCLYEVRHTPYCKGVHSVAQTVRRSGTSPRKTHCCQRAQAEADHSHHRMKLKPPADQLGSIQISSNAQCIRQAAAFTSSSLQGLSATTSMAPHQVQCTHPHAVQLRGG